MTELPPDANPRAAEILARLELFGVRMGLDTTRPLLAALGDPQKDLSCVLVAGTNGKGSVSTLIASFAEAAGYRTGLFQSPHLERVEERIRIGGAAIDGEILADVLADVVAAGEATFGHPPTYFEALAAAAFLHFQRQGVDLAVMEVGMGGRLDATNACDPIAAVITPIGLDHTRYLGDTLTAIAGEKAGILRQDRPAVVWPGGDEAEVALRAKADEVGARLTVGPEAVLERRSEGSNGSGAFLAMTTRRGRYRLPRPLAGHHQEDNLCLAVLAAEALAGDFPGFDDPAHLAAGAAGCRWPGRLERVELPGREPVLLDVAHNPAGALALSDHLRRLDRPYDLLFGAFADKAIADMLPRLAAGADRVVLTKAPTRRGCDPEAMLDLVDPARRLAVAEPSAALDEALAGGRLVVVAGSLYLVGAIRGALRHRFGVPARADAPLFRHGVEGPAEGRPPGTIATARGAEDRSREDLT